VAPDGDVYALQADHMLKRNGSNWEDFTQDFSLSPDGRYVYWLATGDRDGVLQRLDWANVSAGWLTFARAVTKWQVRPDGAVYALQADGNLMVNGQLGWDRTKDFDFSPDGRFLYWLGDWRNGNLLQRFDYFNPNARWYDLPNGAPTAASMIEMRADGSLYACLYGPPWRVILIKRDGSSRDFTGDIVRWNQDASGRIYILSSQEELVRYNFDGSVEHIASGVTSLSYTKQTGITYTQEGQNSFLQDLVGAAMASVSLLAGYFTGPFASGWANLAWAAGSTVLGASQGEPFYVAYPTDPSSGGLQPVQGSGPLQPVPSLSVTSSNPLAPNNPIGYTPMLFADAAQGLSDVATLMGLVTAQPVTAGTTGTPDSGLSRLGDGVAVLDWFYSSATAVTIVTPAELALWAVNRAAATPGLLTALGAEFGNALNCGASLIGVGTGLAGTTAILLGTAGTGIPAAAWWNAVVTGFNVRNATIYCFR
jgi:hypothetical protein